MGGVKNDTIKKAAKVIIEKYYSRLTTDFQTNKRICDEVAVISSKKMRNEIAGYVTRLMKRIQEGPVRGISVQLWEEERERRENHVPKVSVVDTQNVEVDALTDDMLKMMGMEDLPGVTKVAGQ